MYHLQNFKSCCQRQLLKVRLRGGVIVIEKQLKKASMSHDIPSAYYRMDVLLEENHRKNSQER